MQEDQENLILNRLSLVLGLDLGDGLNHLADQAELSQLYLIDIGSTKLNYFNWVTVMIVFNAMLSK